MYNGVRIGVANWACSKTLSMDASRSSPCSEDSDEYISADEDYSTKSGSSPTIQSMKKLTVGEEGLETTRDGETVIDFLLTWI